MSRLAALLGTPAPSRWRRDQRDAASRWCASPPTASPALVAGLAVEPLPPGAVVPALNAHEHRGLGRP